MIEPPPASPPNRRVGPGVAAGVTEAMVHTLVHTFYDRVRADAVIGPIFIRVIGDGWDEHLAKLCDFWSSVILKSGRYQGQPMPAHARITEIKAEHFVHWLDLFARTAREVCPPAAADLFITKSEMIARSLQLGIAVARGELPPLSDRLRA